MMSTLVAVSLVAACGMVGLLAYFTHRFIYLLQTEVEFMEAVATHQKEKAERISGAIEKEAQDSVDFA